jgi:aldehyde dehydrogenase (NAD+)
MAAGMTHTGSIPKASKDGTVDGHKASYIAGGWITSGTGPVAVENPATEETIATITPATVEDVGKAVESARSAFANWAASPIEQRLTLIQRLYDALDNRRAELIQTISLEIGAPTRISSSVHTGVPLSVIKECLRILPQLPMEEEIGNSLVVKEPVGVVAAITPWNYPLHQAVAKVVPALAAGCTVVLNPSTVAPLSLCLLAEAVDEAGFPTGVFNLVLGSGSTVGDALVAHPGVDMVSITGSTEGGRTVARRAAATLKRVSLELGGKSANMLLPDAPVETAVKVGVANAYLNAGQTCSALSRMLVHVSQYDQAVSIAGDLARTFAVGDPFADGVRMGPVVSREQRDVVRKYIETGIAEGARLVAGGLAAPEGLTRGYYVAPTLFADVEPTMTIAREEIFGPVLCVLPYRTVDEAVELANDSDYGLSGGVWSASREDAVAVARRMRTGQVDVNGARFNPGAPWGGFKQSGYGRELGAYGIDEFLEAKSIQM